MLIKTLCVNKFISIFFRNLVEMDLNISNQESFWTSEKSVRVKIVIPEELQFAVILDYIRDV